MIHTDGTPTIANYPRVERRVEPEQGDLLLAILDEPLHTRQSDGVCVELYVCAGEILVRVTDEDGDHRAFVPNDKALDAFHHPYVYLSR